MKLNNVSTKQVLHGNVTTREYEKNDCGTPLAAIDRKIFKRPDVNVTKKKKIVNRNKRNTKWKYRIKDFRTVFYDARVNFSRQCRC